MIPVNPLSLETCVVAIGILLLMAEAFFPKMEKRSFATAGILGLLLVLVLSFGVDTKAPVSAAPYASFYRADALAMFFKQFALVSTILVLVLSMEYARTVERFIPSARKGAGLGEFYTLPLFACAGLMWMASAVDFVMIFVSLELVTLAFYVLVAYMRKNLLSLEAGVKYLILGALSTGFLVYGITWVFGVTSQTNLENISQIIPQLPVGAQPALMFGVALVLVGLGFKIAAAPFQFWVPDVYQGAPSPITAFLSVASKAAGFVVLMRVVQTFCVVPAIQTKLIACLVVLAVVTLVFGNLAALAQTDFKRLMAYSSVAHAGYLLVAIASIGSAISGQAVVFYLAGYLLMTFVAFYVLIQVEQQTGSTKIDAFKGLAKRSPWMAFVLLIALLSLAGLPFTAGFIGKFLVFSAAVQQQHWILLVVGVLTVACGFYYYLKAVRVMYWQDAAPDAAALQMPLLAKVVTGVLSAAIVIFGIYPQPILQLLR